MKISQILEHNKKIDQEKAHSDTSKQPSNELSYREMKSSLSAEVLQDIYNFKREFPQLLEYVIYNIMRKNEFKKSIIDTELKYIASLQQSVIPRNQKKQAKDKPLPGDSKETPQVQKDQKKKKKKKRVEEQNVASENKQNENQEDKRPKEAPEPIRQQPVEFRNNSGSSKYNRGVAKDREQEPVKKNQRQPAKSKRGKNQFRNPDDECEYVPKPKSAEKRDRKNSLVNPKSDPTEKELSNINEESEEPSQHKINLLDSPKHTPKTQNDTHNQMLRDLLNGQGNSSLHFKHQPDNHDSPNRGSLTTGNQLVFEAVHRIDQVVHKRELTAMSLFMRQITQLESKFRQNDRLFLNDRKVNFQESKKRKPMVKNNFETEENDESNTERVKKLNHLMNRSRKFESEEEKFKNERERILESKVAETLYSLNTLNNRMKMLEHEIHNLRSVNDKLIEQNKQLSSQTSDSLYCIVPFEFVKNTYPFDRIDRDELRESNVYIIKR